MEGEIHKSVIDHTGKLKRIRDILNGKVTTPTTEEILAAEEKRLGVKLEIKKADK